MKQVLIFFMGTKFFSSGKDQNLFLVKIKNWIANKFSMNQAKIVFDAPRT